MCAYAIKCNRCVTFDHVNVAPKLNTSPTHVHDACATNVGMMEIEGQRLEKSEITGVLSGATEASEVY